MLSDIWLKSNYKKVTEIVVFDEPLVRYDYWKNEENNNIGVTFSFEFDNDVHLEFEIDQWNKMCIDILKIDDCDLNDDIIVKKLKRILLKFGYIHFRELLENWKINYDAFVG